MGRRGPLPKVKDKDGKPVGGGVALASVVRPAAPVPAAEVPPCPRGLLTVSQRIWDGFWTSRAAQWVDRGSAMSRLIRWIHDVDMYHRILEDVTPGAGKAYDVNDDGVASGVPGVFDSQRPWLGYGSTGKVAAHPSTKLLDELDQRIHRAEIEFGMTPYAAVRLAGAGVQGQLTAAQLSKMLADTRDGAPPEEDAPWAAGFKSAD